MGGQKTELKMIRMSEVESQEVKWLWYPFIPYGKLTIIQGDPGDGKTTLVLNIAAKLSRGECLDSDMDVQEPVNVIYQTAEDGLALIAVKREVAAYKLAGFPWSECQVRKLTTSHCTNNMVYSKVE